MSTPRSPASSSLQRTPSDESLIDDLSSLLAAPTSIVCRVVDSRDRHDKKEISRILGHLPMIREARASRSSQYSDPSSPTRHGNGQSLSGHPPGTPRALGTPRTASSQIGSLAAAGAALTGHTQPSQPQSQQTGQPAGTPRALKGKAAVEAAKQHHISMQEKRLAEEEKRRKEATERQIARLAEIGVDPTGMRAEEILRLLETRSMGTTYNTMNKAAESGVLKRLPTPRCFSDMVTERGQKEIRIARDLPSTQVHQQLDRWEVAYLADVCRTVKCASEADQGDVSLYNMSYGARTLPARRPGMPQAK